MIDIFDSIVHPTVDGTWLNPRFNDNCGLQALLKDMETFSIKRAFAVGLQGVGGYTAETFLKLVRPFPQLLPVAFCEPGHDAAYLEYLKNLGYIGIKIHPRLSKIAEDDERVFMLIRQANALGLIVLYCGFLGATEEFANRIGEEKLLFLHTGGKEFYKTFQILNDKKNILLDLSYTLTEYPEITEEILKVLTEYPERFCIGSDHPEVTLCNLRKRFDELAAHLAPSRARQIAHGNIETFLQDGQRGGFL